MKSVGGGLAWSSVSCNARVSEEHQNVPHATNKIWEHSYETRSKMILWVWWETQEGCFLLRNTWPIYFNCYMAKTWQIEQILLIFQRLLYFCKYSSLWKISRICSIWINKFNHFILNIQAFIQNQLNLRIFKEWIKKA